MTEPHRQSNFNFSLMALEFRFRDWLRPPIKILQEAGVVPGMTVLDFGCGPGGFSLAAARLTGDKGRVYALDINPFALTMVYRAAMKKNLLNIHPIHGSNIDELVNESIDFVLVYDVLHDISGTVSILTEISRVLKADGILSVSNHHLSEASILGMITGSGPFRLIKCGRCTCQFAKIEPSRKNI